MSLESLTFRVKKLPASNVPVIPNSEQKQQSTPDITSVTERPTSLVTTENQFFDASSSQSSSSSSSSTMDTSQSLASQFMETSSPVDHYEFVGFKRQPSRPKASLEAQMGASTPLATEYFGEYRYYLLSNKSLWDTIKNTNYITIHREDHPEVRKYNYRYVVMFPRSFMTDAKKDLLRWKRQNIKPGQDLTKIDNVPLGYIDIFEGNKGSIYGEKN